MEKTVILFFDTEKYPPSLAILVDDAWSVVAATRAARREEASAAVANDHRVWTVPMFFYLLHLYLIHAMAVLVALILHQPYQWLLTEHFGLTNCRKGMGTICRSFMRCGHWRGAPISHARGTRECEARTGKMVDELFVKSGVRRGEKEPAAST